ncbi:MAG: hypothetical protein PUB43_00445 [Oscillospiraceae bacterium]|nr:hypothetical protein [Oscillospiraceae bacterium]
MKKSYESPKIMFESLAFSSSVSSGCEVLSTPIAAFVCPVLDPEIGGTIFTTESACDFTSPSLYDKICYDVPLENHNVFSS